MCEHGSTQRATADAPTAPASVAAARRLEDFYAPNGWHAAITNHERGSS